MIAEEDKNLLILASAGSGKTYQLSNRIIALVAGKIKPQSIVALTFTRKAAAEFADTVLTKLAEAVENPAAAQRLANDIGLPDADFQDTLLRVKNALPEIILGTMDSFFSKIIRGFQYEMGITGGRFDLLEGQRADAARDEILAEVLGSTLQEDTVDELLHVFRRATIGNETSSVASTIREFIRKWHAHLRHSPKDEWGPTALNLTSVDTWESQKAELIAKIRRNLGDIHWTQKGQPKAFDIMLHTLSEHRIGSGSLEKGNTLLKNSLAIAATNPSVITVKSHKEFTIGGIAGQTLLELLQLAAHAEISAAIQRTQAIREAIESFDLLCESRLRRKGLLGFDDVKILMGEWAHHEEARLRREAIDFRLDARYEHWLLDEFQDTSRAEWNGLFPLLYEAANEGGNGTMFVVGDKKQAIYGWRGGDVRLFDELVTTFNEGLKKQTIKVSWRSCPEVLELVNRICGDHETLDALFPEASARWQWEDHVSAPPLTTPAKSGEARVEICKDQETQLDRIVDILNEIGIGKKDLTCGILVRKNDQVKAIADHLRNHDFDVIEEGSRKPGLDNPIGVFMIHLLKWLSDPTHRTAREIMDMSPLASQITAYGEDPQAWEALTSLAAEHGFAHMMEAIIAPQWGTWSDFGKRRASDLMGALSSLDLQGGVTAREAAAWLEGMQIPQTPGAAAVQVMTVHKSKGLGFDVVILPEIQNTVIPEANRFHIASGEGWVCQPPVQWARKFSPALMEAESRWRSDQQYEAICTLYVALTRAKRAQYVLMEPLATTSKDDKSSLCNWISCSLHSNNEPGVIFQSGSSAWIEQIPWLEKQESHHHQASLAAAVPRRHHTTATTVKDRTTRTHSNEGLSFGQEVHRLFESISWIDEQPVRLPDNTVGKIVGKIIQLPALQSLFARSGRNITLLLEQPIEAIHNGKWFSGVIDRMLLHHHEDGSVTHVEIIDYKTDDVGNADALLSLHRSQMNAYRDIVSHIYPQAEITATLISTALKEAIRI